jgi:hypothetical protein
MLIGNGQLYDKIPLTLLGDRWCGFVRDEIRLLQSNSEGFTTLSSFPDGYNPHKSIVPPRKAGGTRGTSRNGFDVTPTGGIYGGITETGSSSIGIDTNTPDGELIATIQPGDAPSTFGISTNTPDLTASLNGSNDTTPCTIGISTNTPYIIADGWITTDICEIGMSGDLVMHAIGIMEGTTAESGVTVDNVVNGVWNALLADYSSTGSAGKALATASSGGVDLDLMAQAVLDAAQVTPIHADAKKVNGVDLAGTGIAPTYEGQPTPSDPGDPWRPA